MRVGVVLAASLALLLGGCASEGQAQSGGEPARVAEDSSPTNGPQKQTVRSTKPSVPAPGTVLKTAGSDYGTILFDRTGQAIYLFDKESTGEPECYGACAEAWPPVLSNGEPQATGGVSSKLLGTVERRDGSTQVTYGGHPLYYYVHDPKNEVFCHNVVEYGGLWLVVTPEGEAAT
jgi:predicted lipoprotein with Yx(FWY)xxD motif